MTEQDLIAATHEAAHAAAAWLLGLQVDEVTIDRHAQDMDGFGRCATSFPANDTRSVAEMAAARAVLALAAVLVAPGRGAQSDSDVEHAYRYAAIAGEVGAGAERWVQRQSEAAQRLIKTDIFRRLMNGISYELIAARALDVEAVESAVRAVPGGVSAGLAARG